jgi:ankyrin repeat protein
VQKHPPGYSYSACLILSLYFLGLIFLHQYGVTALMCASGLGDIPMVDFLLTKGANIASQTKVCYAVSLQYLSRQNKQVVEDCIAPATYDVTD